jgi:hypothetical protein
MCFLVACIHFILDFHCGDEGREEVVFGKLGYRLNKMQGFLPTPCRFGATSQAHSA